MSWQLLDYWIRGRDEFNILEFEAEVIDGFVNQVCVFIADLLELGRGDIDEKLHSFGMAIARRLKPSVVGVAVHLFFECV